MADQQQFSAKDLWKTIQNFKNDVRSCDVADACFKMRHFLLKEAVPLAERTNLMRKTIDSHKKDVAEVRKHMNLIGDMFEQCLQDTVGYDKPERTI